MGLLGGVAGTPLAFADNLRVQSIPLQRGWNSVFLEVFPTNSAPEAVFSNTPVSIVARYFPLANAVEFLRDPVRINWQKDGWSVWYATRRGDAFLTTLFAIEGNRAYLVYAEQEFVWTVEGRVLFEPVRWKSDSFNHVGFGVEVQSPPTFGRFFAGSAAHSERRIYRLVDERWTRVTNPDQTLMRSGEACWIYCRGASDFQGPLAVDISGGRAVTFGSQGLSRLTLGNASPDPLEVQTEWTGDVMPLSYVLRALAGDRLENLFLPLPQQHRLPALEGGARSYFTLQVRREDMGQRFQSGVLRLSTDSGAVVWLPVSAEREDLTLAP